jgi:hypothetical protein
MKEVRRERMEREIRITRAGFLYVDGKKASDKRITPFYVGADVLTSEEQAIARKWANNNYKMVNN